MIGQRLGTILTPNSRVLWLTTWKMVGFVLNGFVFVLIGLELPEVVDGLGGRPAARSSASRSWSPWSSWWPGSCGSSRAACCPGSPRRVVARRDPALATPSDVRRQLGRPAWRGLPGRRPGAAHHFPERDLILLITFGVILATLVGQGLTLPAVLRWAGWDGVEFGGDELTLARTTAYEAGLEEIERTRPDWPDHQPLFDRLESGLRDRTEHLATEDPDETAERRKERIEHEEIQRRSSARSGRPSSASAIGARSTTRRSARSNASSTSKSSGWRAEAWRARISTRPEPGSATRVSGDELALRLGIDRHRVDQLGRQRGDRSGRRWLVRGRRHHRVRWLLNAFEDAGVPLDAPLEAARRDRLDQASATTTSCTSC